MTPAGLQLSTRRAIPVAAHFLGIGIQEVSIAPGDDGSAGHVVRSPRSIKTLTKAIEEAEYEGGFGGFVNARTRRSAAKSGAVAAVRIDDLKVELSVRHDPAMGDTWRSQRIESLERLLVTDSFTKQDLHARFQNLREFPE